MHHLLAKDYDTWHLQARDLLSRNVLPHHVTWDTSIQPDFFLAELPPAAPGFQFHVPRAFAALAAKVACHVSVHRWDLLYQLVFRLTHGERHLLKISTDPLTHALERMEQAVRRDAHKTKAFVRFRLVKEDGRDHYIAWHRPDHHVLPLVVPFFARRFSTMVWTILTPDASVHWDGEQLIHGPGVEASEAPQDDILESLWRDYYRATFNPARIKLKMMKREMPVRHWATLPETSIIAEMLAEAPARVEAMLAHSEGAVVSAANFLPEERGLRALRDAARACQGCELHQCATQTVFGVGPANAKLMLVGEQPGDQEDKGGQPFIGPAGAVLDEALEAAGLSRDDIYITNAVKHFRFLYQDSFRQHRAPSRYHVQACKPWLTAEIATIQPRALVCLGNTAARSLINPGFTMKLNRGEWFAGTPPMLATYHPASILRSPRSLQEQWKRFLSEDLQKAALCIAA